METGTLKELNVQPGDVVECVKAANDGWAYAQGDTYRVSPHGALNGIDARFHVEVTGIFRIISRATPQPDLTGPVRTVTRKEIVPGVYGGVEVTHVDGFENVCIRIDTGFSAIGLRRTIATLTQIADALEDQA